MRRKHVFPRGRCSPRFLLAASLLFLTDWNGITLLALLAAGLHELGHLWVAFLLKIPIASLQLDFLGARLSVSGRILSYKEEWLLAAAGPLASLSGSILGFCFPGEAGAVFSCASLLLGLLNLLPVRSFDGGRMLDAFLSAVFSPTVAYRVVTVGSLVTLFLLWAASVYLLLRSGNGIAFYAFSMGLFERFLEELPQNGTRAREDLGFFRPRRRFFRFSGKSD